MQKTPDQNSHKATSAYRTQSLYEAAYLLAKGFKLSGQERSSNKSTLLFKDSPKLQVAVMAFYNRGTIEAKRYTDAYRTLKDFVFTR